MQRGQELLNVNPPKVEEYQSEDDEDEDDDETRPLTRDELKIHDESPSTPRRCWRTEEEAEEEAEVSANIYSTFRL